MFSCHWVGQRDQFNGRIIGIHLIAFIRIGIYTFFGRAKFIGVQFNGAHFTREPRNRERQLIDRSI